MKVRLFAGLREKFGEVVDVPLTAPCTVADVQNELVSMNCWIPGTRLAVDRRFAVAEDAVDVDSVLAAIPPVTGG